MNLLRQRPILRLCLAYLVAMTPLVLIGTHLWQTPGDPSPVTIILVFLACLFAVLVTALAAATND